MNDQSTEAAEAPEKSFIQRWIDMYFSPGEAFQSINRKPDWVMPLLIAAIIAAIATVFLTNVIMETQLQQLMDRQGLSYDEAQQQIEQGAVFIKYGGPIGALISTFIMAFIVAGIFYLVNSFLLGGESTYKHVLSVWSHTTLAVQFVGSIVAVPLMRAKNSFDVPLSPAAFMSSDSKEDFLYKFLAKFDLFTIWMVILLIIGFGVIYKFSRGKAAGSVLGLWFIWILLSITLSNVFGGMFGG
jgi:hypothetical protein